MRESINQILNSFLYPKELIERLINQYGVKRTYSLLDALKKPVSRYSLRVNTLKCTAEELIDQFAEENIDAHQHPCYKDVVQIRLSGPNELPVHSKIVTVDDRWCMLGSANMDVRSFRLNFEITALIYDADVARELSGSIEHFCKGARPITAREVRNRRLHQQIIEGTARLLTPLL